MNLDVESVHKRSRVTTTLRLMWAFYAICVAYIILGFNQLIGTGVLPWGALRDTGIVYAVGLLGLAFLILMAGRRKNWARIGYIVFAGLIIAWSLLAATNLLSRPDGVEPNAVVRLVVPILAYGFLITRLLHSSSREWFKAGGPRAT